MNNSDNKSKFGAYKKTDVLTANRETILLMMYSAAIRFLKQAIEAINNDDQLERTKYIGKTQQIISELRSTLNFEAGGDIAKRLEGLYGFITDRLVQGNLEKNTKPLNEALDILVTLNSAWETAVGSIKQARKGSE